MTRGIRLATALLIPLLMWVVLVQADGGPSKGAKGMAGATGTIRYEPEDWQEGQTTWWKDSDGIAPGVAGCHVGTDSKGEKPNGRKFGEACLDDGRLVESNPGADGQVQLQLRRTED